MAVTMTRLSAAKGTGDASWSKPPVSRTSVDMDMKALRNKSPLRQIVYTNTIPQVAQPNNCDHRERSAQVVTRAESKQLARGRETAVAAQTPPLALSLVAAWRLLLLRDPTTVPLPTRPFCCCMPTPPHTCMRLPLRTR
eukprot:scaffold2417_cov174-Isochrysis_galbana.AAC.4